MPLTNGGNTKPTRTNSRIKDSDKMSSNSGSVRERRRSSNSLNNLREQPVIHNKLYCDEIPRNPSKVLSKLTHDDLRTVKSHTELAKTANGVRMLARNLAKATIHIDVRSIVIVTKARDNSLIYLTREVVEWLLTLDKDITVYVDNKLKKSKRFDSKHLKESIPKAEKLLKFWDKKSASKTPEKFDLVVTLGGDGTVLFVSNMFQRVVPPVISFSLGSLGFLTNFEFVEFRKKMFSLLDSGVRAYLRMRFTCRVHKANGVLVCEQQVLNELVVDRGPSPFVTQLELYGDGSLLTVAQADGLIIATPTGSTAYSLSAGGSLVHPGVSAISVTPICPHTLSFRPILLPDGMFLKVKVPPTSRATAWASFDGKVRTELCVGDYVTIQASPFPFPTVISSKTEYFDSVSRNLNWNVREQQKPFTDLLSEENKKLYNKSSSLENDLENLHMDGSVSDAYDINYSDETTSSIGSDREEEDAALYMPPPGEGLNTPPSHAISYNNFEERTCFAHPNARITLNEPTAATRYPSSSSTSSEAFATSHSPL